MDDTFPVKRGYQSTILQTAIEVKIPLPGKIQSILLARVNGAVDYNKTDKRTEKLFKTLLPATGKLCVATQENIIKYETKENKNSTYLKNSASKI